MMEEHWIKNQEAIFQFLLLSDLKRWVLRAGLICNGSSQPYLKNSHSTLLKLARITFVVGRELQKLATASLNKPGTLMVVER